MFNWSTLQYKMKYSFNKVVPALYQAGFESKAKKISECGHFKELAICNNCGETYLNGFNTCKDRFCPVCEKKRSYLWLAKLAPIVKEYLSDKKIINMLTLTIVDELNLKDALSILSKTWRVMVHDDKSLAKNFKTRFIGGFRALEVKRGKYCGLWHAHYHCLVIKDIYSKDFEFIKTSWQKAYRIVTGKNVSLEVRIDDIRKNYKQDIGIILEVAKYVTKFDWSFNDDVKELVESLIGVRTTSTWGCLRKKLTEQNIENDMDKTLNQVVDLVCKSCGNDTFDILEGLTGNNYMVSDYMENELSKGDIEND